MYDAVDRTLDFPPETAVILISHILKLQQNALDVSLLFIFHPSVKYQAAVSPTVQKGVLRAVLTENTIITYC